MKGSEIAKEDLHYLTKGELCIGERGVVERRESHTVIATKAPPLRR